MRKTVHAREVATPRVRNARKPVLIMNRLGYANRGFGRA